MAAGSTYIERLHPRDHLGRYRDKPYGEGSTKTRAVSGEPRLVSAEDADEWASGAFEDPESLSAQEAEAMSTYKRDAWEDVNPVLRGQEDAYEGADNIIEDMDAVLERNRLPEDIVVTRGASRDVLPEKWLDAKGTRFTDDAYMSTSFGEEPPGVFADAEVILELKVPKGTPAYYMEPFTEFANDELELLLGRGRTFEIDGVKLRPRGKGQLPQFIVSAEVLSA